MNTIHKLSNNGKMLLKIIEVRCGEYLEEDDIERLESINE
jgi:mannose-6-phosphate isomerase-like protein (cupin superfamily)